MTRSELVKEIANSLNLPQPTVGKVVIAVFETIVSELKKGQEVQIANFGKYSARKVDKRKGRNPRTGEEIIIEAHKRIEFKPFEQLKKAVN